MRSPHLVETGVCSGRLMTKEEELLWRINNRQLEMESRQLRIEDRLRGIGAVLHDVLVGVLLIGALTIIRFVFWLF